MPEPRYVELSGWGRYPRLGTSALRPGSSDELPALLSGRTSASLIARGLGRSYGDAAVCAGGATLLMERLHGIRSFDPGSGVLRCEAGVALGEIVRQFVPKGWFLPVTPGTQRVTIGGAIAADVFGRNHLRAGTLARHVRGFSLLTADGKLQECQPGTPAFEATFGGFGLTGLIVEAELQLRRVETAWMRSQVARTGSIREMLDLFEERGASEYLVARFDLAGVSGDACRGLVTIGDHHPLEGLDRVGPGSELVLRERRKFTLGFDIPALLYLKPAVGLLSRAIAWLRRGDEQGSRVVDLIDFFYPLDFFEDSNRLFGSRGLLQYHCAFPRERAAEACAAILNSCARQGYASLLPALQPLGPGRGLLSFPIQGYSLALDFPARPDVLHFLDRLDDLVIELGGRVYLAKDARLPREKFERMYPEAERWRKLRAELDPGGIFGSGLSRRLGL